ncbi:MAG: MBL fold metallo-hydrolase [Deltaproteobacteria bacterium]|nr:MBL fold metallo-hydrolase [Deltaproteobacteria bacterium]
MPGLHTLSLPTPFPVGPVNAYVLLGPEPCLIDPGLCSSASTKALEDGLRAIDLKIESIRHVLLTHRHVDHAGAAALICAKSGATLHAHASNRWLSPESEAEEKRLMGFLIDCGVDAELLRKVQIFFGLTERFWGQTVFSGTSNPLRGGEHLQLGAHGLECISTPGHSPDHLCFWDAQEGLLFSGDMLLADITPNPLIHLGAQGRSPSLLNYLDSLQVVEDLAADRALAGHGPAIEDPRALIQRNRQHISQRAARFASLLEDKPMTPEQLAQAFFGELDPMNHVLAVSETVAYLDLLEREGKARVNWQAPFLVWGQTPAHDT